MTAACIEVYCEYFSRILGPKVMFWKTTRFLVFDDDKAEWQETHEKSILHSCIFWPICRQYEDNASLCQLTKYDSPSLWDV